MAQGGDVLQDHALRMSAHEERQDVSVRAYHTERTDDLQRGVQIFVSGESDEISLITSRVLHELTTRDEHSIRQ